MTTEIIEWWLYNSTNSTGNSNPYTKEGYSCQFGVGRLMTAFCIAERVIRNSNTFFEDGDHQLFIAAAYGNLLSAYFYFGGSKGIDLVFCNEE